MCIHIFNLTLNQVAVNGKFPTQEPPWLAAPPCAATRKRERRQRDVGAEVTNTPGLFLVSKVPFPFEVKSPV